MAEKLTQDGQLLHLSTPLGPDVLIPAKFEGRDSISDKYEYKIYCLLNADEDPVDPQDIIGEPCTLKIFHGNKMEEEAFFHGLCVYINHRGYAYEHAIYEIHLVPWTWLLTLEQQCEVFHDKKPDEIIKQVFDDRGMSDYEFSLSKTYDTIHYCVQYQESTFNFVSRIMEKFGMYYYFKHEDGKHTLVIVDSVDTLTDIEASDTKLVYRSAPGTGERQQTMYGWNTGYQLRTGQVDTDDYNYEKPNTPLEKVGEPTDGATHTHKTQTYYHYPTGYYEPGVGQKLADVMVDQFRARADGRRGGGNVPFIRAGYKFELDEFGNPDENKKYFTYSTHHHAFQPVKLSTRGGIRFLTDSMGTTRDANKTFKHPHFGEDYGRSDYFYYNTFAAKDPEKPFNAPRRAFQPRIAGAQTAKVIKSKNAPDDEEIDVDDKGRILVEFHWNSHSENADQCSARVRVAQIWAGSGWGGVWIPRVDMEVVVDFLDGDPDRPLVTGCVYNGNNEASIKFPDDKTQSTIKSQSSKGGTSAENFNELRFEDKKDDEEIYIHAERDRKMIIEHDDDIEIGNNQTETITGSRTFELTGGDETVTLKGDGGTKDKYGTSNAKKGHRTTTLKEGDETLTVDKGKRTTTIEKDDKRTIRTGNDIHEINTGNQTTTIKQGNQTTKISMGKGTTTAMQSFEIKVGSSSIKLTPTKITIKSVQIDINGSATLKTNGGAMAEHKAGGMLQLKGGIIKIN